MSFFAMSGAGRAPIATVGTVTGNVSTDNGSTHALGNIDVGAASGDKNVLLEITWGDDSSKSISTLTVGGVALTQKVTVDSGGGFNVLAAIWAGDIKSISGSQAISVTFSGNIESVGVSGVAVSGLRSLTPTMTDSDSTTSGSPSTLTITSLAAEVGGIAMACGGSSGHNTAAEWSSLTERADLKTGESSSVDHRHTAAWDLGFRSAANETVDSPGGTRAAVGAGFR